MRVTPGEMPFAFCDWRNTSDCWSIASDKLTALLPLVRLVVRCTIQTNDGIADDFVDRGVMLDEQIAHAVQILIQDL